MEKILKVFLCSSMNDYIQNQEVWCDDCPQISYRVYDLCECPEDAIIGRDLFSGYEYIEAIKLGMELAKQGYSGIEIEEMAE